MTGKNNHSIFFYLDYYPTSTAGRWCATLAMLTGVFVIAFPVSVFSDLWSEELKYGFLDDDDRDRDDTEQQPPSSQDKSKSEPPAGAGAASTSASTGNRNYQFIHATDASSENLVIQKQDLREILQCVKTIQKSELRMRSILRKYNLESELYS
jgi:hypothetical protein